MKAVFGLVITMDAKFQNNWETKEKQTKTRLILLLSLKTNFVDFITTFECRYFERKT